MKTNDLIDKIILNIREGMKNVAANVEEMEILVREEFGEDELVLTSMINGGLHVQRLVLYINKVKHILETKDNWKTDQILSVLQDVLNSK